MIDIEEEIASINRAMRGIEEELAKLEELGEDTTSMSNTFSLLASDLDDYVRMARDEITKRNSK